MKRHLSISEYHIFHKRLKGIQLEIDVEIKAMRLKAIGKDLKEFDGVATRMLMNEVNHELNKLPIHF